MWAPPEHIPTVAELVAAVNQTVSGLDEQKLRLATVLRRHMIAAVHGREYRQANILLVGPTGGGKTFLVREMLEAAGVIYAETNMTQYSEVGYVGLDLSSAPMGLLIRPWLGKGDQRRDLVTLAQRWGVLVLDEFDKVHFKRDPSGRDTGRTLQAELLRMAEGDTVFARAKDSEMGTPFDTHNILFLAMGAFENLGKIVDPSQTTPHAYVRAEPAHIRQYGFMEELVGRFSTIIALPPLNEDHMYRILIEHIWPHWLQMAEDEGIVLRYEDRALRLCANQAAQTGIGARGLEPQLERALWKAWATVRPGQEIWFGGENLATGAVVQEVADASAA